ncbi:MAG TPA: VCBS repeat-containing protein, partial [Candidatus Marinimicrobia bacterium]|nr:VCBS repeat-containing protein [Candidatus Neomarinimicrobiota bacterium]
MRTKALFRIFTHRFSLSLGILVLFAFPPVLFGQYVTFSDVSQSAGVAEPDSGTGHGVTFADFNGDGLLDIYMVNWWNQPNFLFINNGDGTFTNRAGAYGVTVPLGSDRGVSAADFDNDGDMDFYVSSGGQNYFFRNDNNQGFTNITYAAGVIDWGEGMNVCFGDYDNDGNLDLLITNQGYGENQLFHNNGDGTFSKVTEQAGLGDYRRSNGTAFFDYDNDGYPDIFIARGTRDENYSGLLYHNNGNGTFTEVAGSAGVGVSG